MLSLVVDLGSLELETSEPGWQARLHASAEFAASEKDDVDGVRERLTNGALNHYSDDSPWIDIGHAFRFEICLRLGTPLDPQEQDMLADKLAVQLRTAKLWQQLYLTPIAVEVSNFEKDVRRLNVALEYCGDRHEQGRRRIHELAADVPLHATQPPAGIPTVAFQSLHLDLSLEKSNRRKRRRVRRPKSDERISVHAGNDSSHEDQEPVFNTTASVAHCGVDGREMNASTFRIDGKTGSSGLDVGAHPRNGDPSHDVDTLLMTEIEHCTSPGRLSASEAATSLLKRTSSLPDLQLLDESIDLRTILELIDAAIRQSITKSPKQIAQKVKCTASESLKHVAPLAPSLWSPGYLPNVASRAVFIPTISHALAAVVSVSSRRSNAGAQSRTEPRQHSNISDDAEPISYSLPSIDIMSRQLWRLLARNVFDPCAARRLAPLCVARHQTDVVVEAECEMLDLHVGQERIHSDEVDEDDFSSLDDLSSLEDFDFEDEMLIEEVMPDRDKMSIDRSDTGVHGLLSICESLFSLESLKDDVGV